MLWDVGTWTPETDDIDAALKKGDLKLTLNGYKLKGSWVLVRTAGRWAGGGGRSWLLIKHRDEWAGDVDITEFAPRSVKSEGDFEDILAADRPDVWVSNRPAKGGEAGAMLAKIIERAAALKSGKSSKSLKETSGADPSERQPTEKPATARTRKKAAATKSKTSARKPRASQKKTRSASRQY